MTYGQYHVVYRHAVGVPEQEKGGHKNYLKQVVKKGYLMKLAKDGKGLSRGANKDTVQWTAPPAQEASRSPVKGHLYLSVSPISGSLFAILLL